MANASVGSGSAAEPQGEQLDYLHRRFGSGYETITGLSGFAHRHEDRATRVWLFSSVVWFVVVTLFGLTIASELVSPELFGGIPWLIFSRVRPAHVQGIFFAWLTMMYWGAIFYFSPRLLGTTRLRYERLGVWTAWFYNLAMVVGLFAILTGGSTGREWQEFPWIVGVAIELAFLSNLANVLGTMRVRKVRPLYVSMWWAVAAPMWLVASLFIGKVMWQPGVIWPLHGTVGNPSGYLPTGIHDVMINWWGNHNLFGLWLTPVLIAVCYYFVPRITNTPLYGHTLSLLSFWGLVFVYTAVGDHHLLQTPTPGWLKTIASVDSVAILIPVSSFFTNIFLTMRGQWNKFLTSLPLRFVLTGFIMYLLSNVQGALQAVQPFNVYIHFTYFVIAHSHLALLGGFTILGMGVIYYVLPHILNKPPYSRGLAECQYWLVTLGWVIMLIALTGGAFIQGQGWMSGLNEVLVLPSLRIWNSLRGISGGMIFTSGLIQAYNIFMTATTDTYAVAARRSREDAASALLGVATAES
jgi:cbb3-type cytochrome c oxidase subunit I